MAAPLQEAPLPAALSCRPCMRLNVCSRLKVVAQLIWKFPHTVIVPLLVLGALLGVGVWGVQMVQHSRANENKQVAEYEALSAAQGITTDAAQAMTSVLQLAALAQKYPNMARFQTLFDQVVETYWKGAPAGATAFTVSILGVVKRIYLAVDLDVKEAATSNNAFGSDMMSPDNPSYRNLMISSLLLRRPRITGPFATPPFGIMVASLDVAVFVPGVDANQTWGTGREWTACPPGVCYDNATRTKAWGSTNLIMRTDMWFNKSGAINQMTQKGYKLVITRGPNVDLGETDPLVRVYNTSSATEAPDYAVQVPVSAQGSEWQLWVWKEGGWSSDEFRWLYAVVAVGGVIIAALLFTVLVSWAENKAMLHSVLPKEAISRLRQEAQWATTQKEELKAIQLETPAEGMLSIIGTCLVGEQPPIPRLLAMRDALHRSADVYRPTATTVKARMEQAEFVDEEVRQALVNQLAIDTSGADSEPGSDSLKRMGKLNPTYDSPVSPGSIAPDKVISAHRTASSVMMHPTSDSMCLNDADLRKSSGRTTPLQAFSSRTVAELLRQDPAPRTRRMSCLSPPQLPSEAEAGGTQEPHTANEDADSQEDDSLTEAPVACLSTKVEQALAAVDDWAFDAYVFEDAAGGYPLSILGAWLMQTSGLSTWARMDMGKLVKFLQTVEDGYSNLNPYHNKRHAADVLQSMHVILQRSGLTPGYVDSATHLACYLAAIVHDYEHRGRNNDYLINSYDPLAVRYNDRSPMENHHLAAAFSLIREPELDFLSELPKATFNKIRKLVIDLVLATDMKQHFAILGQFTALHSQSEDAQPSSGPPSVDPRSLSVMGSVHSVSAYLVPASDVDKVLSLQLAMKCSDLGHLTAPLPVHLKWVSALEQEFFLQGDAEKAQGLPISPLCDRTKEGVYKSQVGFFQFVAVPLYKAFTSRFTQAMPLATALGENLKYWQAQANQHQK